jgi:hypothetical protein
MCRNTLCLVLCICLESLRSVVNTSFESSDSRFNILEILFYIADILHIILQRLVADGGVVGAVILLKRE